MDLNLPAGQYVVAVSGGVDSVSLLHLLHRKNSASKVKPWRLVVAHFDHGIREDSAEDRKFVQELARKYGLPFVYDEGKLGAGASEAEARRARYDFLQKSREACGADAVITAHHLDDLLETVILNLLRGTNRHGLSSLRNTDVLKRPLLDVPKQQIKAYAQANGLAWREDSTNVDDSYLRNYVRHNIMPRFGEKARIELAAISTKAAHLNLAIDEELAEYLRSQPKSNQLLRLDFIQLPHAVAREVMAEWLLRNSTAELSRKLLERLVVFAKTGHSGSRTDVNLGYWLYVFPTLLALEPKER